MKLRASEATVPTGPDAGVDSLLRQALGCIGRSSA